ncbi:Orexin receptor type 2 [Folsomia candida]|uniref:Orexin receptor type 2 n=1 Tax=Folsomia candida TaxID=158441 RepID=A0A226DAN9_FOLCA|nr:Orexin receptor type 2 [Folsomia candida]
MVATEEDDSLQYHNSSAMGGPSYFSWILSPTVAIVFAISIVGSISIFFLVCISKTFRRTSNYLVANLCIASVYHITISLFYNLQSGGVISLDPKYGETACQILSFVHRLSTPVLPLTIAAISLDRSVVARNPQDYPSRKTAIARVAMIWTFSLILLIPRASMSMFDEKIKGNFKCRKVLLWNSIFLHTSYAVVTLFVIYIIPTYILVKEFFAMRCQMRFLMMSQARQRFS